MLTIPGAWQGKTAAVLKRVWTSELVDRKLCSAQDESLVYMPKRRNPFALRQGQDSNWGGHTATQVQKEAPEQGTIHLAARL